MYKININVSDDPSDSCVISDLIKTVKEYDQEIPQSQTPDNPVAP